MITEIVDVAKFGPTASVGVWTLVLLAIITLIKGWPRLREIQAGADESLRADLLARINALEGQVQRLEKMLGQKDAEHAAEMQMLRGRLNNETAALDALLLLLETAPEKISESVHKIKELRERRNHTFALERGAMAGAAMASARGSDVAKE